jgi:hypothetical protein
MEFVKNHDSIKKLPHMEINQIIKDLEKFFTRELYSKVYP